VLRPVRVDLLVELIEYAIPLRKSSMLFGDCFEAIDQWVSAAHDYRS
jgi:hypothetical protein